MMTVFQSTGLRGFSRATFALVTIVPLCFALLVTVLDGYALWVGLAITVMLCLPTALLRGVDLVDSWSTDRRKRHGQNGPTALTYWDEVDTVSRLNRQ